MLTADFICHEHNKIVKGEDIMAAIFGADSKHPARARLTNGYDLYSWVMRKSGFPAFWGRAITGGNKITEEEIKFLQEKKCKVALYFDELTEVGVSSMDGTDDALRAVEGAKALGVPVDKGIAIFAVIGGDWSVNHNWMISFASMVRNNGFVAGFFGNTDSSKNFNFNRQCGHYVRATEEAGYFGAVFGATEPKPGGEAAVWTPYYPSDMNADRIALWQNGTIACDGIEANTTYAHDESVLSYMW